jgi:hypothetical protein
MRLPFIKGAHRKGDCGCGLDHGTAACDVVQLPSDALDRRSCPASS